MSRPSSPVKRFLNADADAMLPNLIVIGAARCGTTSLHRYLDLHPEVAMSEEKELNFFSVDTQWERGVSWYERQFASGTLVRGEASPSYSAYPRTRGVPARMASVIPGARLIYLVRDPIERLFSAYRFARFVLRNETREFSEAVRDFDASRYVVGSRYALQLEQYLAYYSREQILVLEQADLLNRRAQTMRVVFRFARVDENFAAVELSREHNPTEGLRANRAGKAAIALLDRVFGPSRAAALRARVPLPLARPLLRAPSAPEVQLDDGLRAELKNFLGEDASRLRRLTGQRFATWSV
jgi:Sulfotransferase domain